MTTVPQHTYGSAGASLPAMSLGSFHTWDRTAFEELVQIVKRAIDTGAAMFDVGIYRAGFPLMAGVGSAFAFDSPTDVLLGRAIQVAGIAREDYLLSIKAWRPRRFTLARQVDDTLLRHGTDYADLIVLGYGPRPEDLEQVVVDVKALIDAGKVRHWGVNNWSPANIRTATDLAARHGLEAPQLAQMIYSLTRRTMCESEPFTSASAATGISLQASNIFDGGLLLGKGRQDGIAPGSVAERVHGLRHLVVEAALGLGMTPGQFAFAFPLCNPATANVLVGARTLAQFEDLVATFDLLDRVGVDAIRAKAAEFWVDRDDVDPHSGW